MLAQVGMTNKLDKDDEDEDGKRLEASMQALSRRHVGLQSTGSDKVIPLDALRVRAQMVCSNKKADEGDEAVKEEMALHDSPGTVFEQTSCEGVERSTAILRGACDP